MITRKELALECGCCPKTLYNYLHNPQAISWLREQGVDIGKQRSFTPHEAHTIRHFLGITPDDSG